MMMYLIERSEYDDDVVADQRRVKPLKMLSKDAADRKVKVLKMLLKILLIERSKY